MNRPNRLARFLPCCQLAAALLLVGTARAGVPGDATTPPRTVTDPNPPAPADGRATGVLLGVWIRADGTVEDAELIKGDRAWGVQAMETAKQWVFQPVLWEGRGIPARVEVGFSVQGGRVVSSLSPLPNLPGERHVAKEFGLVPPVLTYDPDVILPLEGRLMKTTPQVTLSYVVEADGSTGQFEVVDAGREQALRAALDLVSVQKFQPATVHGEPVVVEYTQGVSFRGTSEPIAGLEGVTAVVDPVYPYERLLAREEGLARVRFQLSADGFVAEVAVIEATHPDFGAALVAAVESWAFTVESAKETPEREFEYEFALNRVPYGARRLADFVREGGVVSNRAAGLDARPKVLARPGVVYPRALLAGASEGSAKIEFVVDRSGLAQLPRVVEASAPEFGWAAATCVNGMRFAPISREGKATELRVVIPVQFSPPVASALAPATVPSPGGN